MATNFHPCDILTPLINQSQQFETFLNSDQWSVATYNMYTFIINGIVITMLVVVGILGNTISSIVFSGRVMKTQLSPYFVALGIWDTIFLVTSFMLFSVYSLLPDASRTSSYAYAYTLIVSRCSRMSSLSASLSFIS